MADIYALNRLEVDSGGGDATTMTCFLLFMIQNCQFSQRENPDQQVVGTCPRFLGAPLKLDHLEGAV